MDKRSNVANLLEAQWVRDKALALLHPDKGPRSMENSTVYTCQDAESECETD